MLLQTPSSQCLLTAANWIWEIQGKTFSSGHLSARRAVPDSRSNSLHGVEYLSDIYLLLDRGCKTDVPSTYK